MSKFTDKLKCDVHNILDRQERNTKMVSVYIEYLENYIKELKNHIEELKKIIKD